MKEPGLIHYYFGNGKGKTTAALGIAVRALGYGRRVVLVQFLKGRPSGEVLFFENAPGVTMLRGDLNTKMASAMTEAEREETRRIHDSNLAQAMALAHDGACDLLVLDEVSDAFRLGLLDTHGLFAFMRAKPDALEIVMTGHEALPDFMDIADYVTEMKKHKHPYNRGIIAREGVEF